MRYEITMLYFLIFVKICLKINSFACYVKEDYCSRNFHLNFFINWDFVQLHHFIDVKSWPLGMCMHSK